MEATYADVARELTKRYSAIKDTLKKGEKDIRFLLIVKKLFEEFGEYFGFELDELSEFQKAIINARNNGYRTKANSQKAKVMPKNKIKRIKQKTQFNSKIKKVEFEQDEFYFYKKGKYKPKEGEGLIYTIDEVERYGLNNSGSYF